MKKLLKAAIFIALGGIAGMCFALGSDQSDWTAAGLIIVGVLAGCLVTAALMAVEKMGRPLLCMGLAATLLLAPFRANAQTNSPQPNFIGDCALLAVVGVMVLVPVYLCIKYSQPNPPPPAPPAPPQHKPGTSPLVWMPAPPGPGVPVLFTGPTPQLWDVSANGWTNWDGQPVTGEFGFSTNLETSTDLIHWEVETFSVTGWVSMAETTNTLTVFYTNGTPACTNFSVWPDTNRLSFGTSEAKRFWKQP